MPNKKRELFTQFKTQTTMSIKGWSLAPVGFIYEIHGYTVPCSSETTQDR